ncbi:cell wall metabolism sensor histidine kinase WalK [Paenibacillus sp. OV219]|uniref:sensor histidine kinase n=1 Tax=Paenibacillus sp. OV219 TaxID=1884377 RepID=UPI0008BCBF8D|nr:HAMP domain-containing sensor histidine kinase [Paenibacillus sp. OV219]SEM55357.1 Signal transduction histidine kinase [Paenibacillus sp. OV219]
MRSSIVVKLFILTTTLCMLILAVVYFGQTYFFKDYYANRKVSDLQAKMEAFKTAYMDAGGNSLAIQSLEQDFYRNNNVTITGLDHNGNLKDVNDFYLEIRMLKALTKAEEKERTKVPLYQLMNMEEAASGQALIAIGEQLIVTGVKSNSILTPIVVQHPSGELLYANELFKRKFYKGSEKAGSMEKRKPLESDQTSLVNLFGVVTDVRLPNGGGSSDFIYSNKLFLEQINAFQEKLLFEELQLTDSLVIQDYEQNNVKYKLFIQPVHYDNGTTNYIFAMASLQPVDEAVQMMKDYYVYIIVFVIVLILIAALYFSMKIARPLLRINQTTKKIANLDFSETIPIKSKDEIGDLSRNINQLSATLHSYIGKLQEDIAREKQLETTRKEFISGVSHELKTPLSVMKSCISILKDGVAAHKKDHYFEAMEKEVDKMDHLIVDMLELAKYESGTYRMQMDAFFVDKLIESVCEQLAHEIAAKQLRVSIQLVPALVVANQHRIEQVITNFMTNAIRYTPEGQEIVISTTDEANHVVVCVENKGARIPEEQLDKVWDRFYRGDTARQRSDGGTGLGLAISKNILELHGARYGAANTKDGVAFFFCLNKQS